MYEAIERYGKSQGYSSPPSNSSQYILQNTGPDPKEVKRNAEKLHPQQMRDIYDYLKNNKKIDAIKVVRSSLFVDLLMAKYVVEMLENRKNNGSF